MNNHSRAYNDMVVGSAEEYERLMADANKSESEIEIENE